MVKSGVVAGALSLSLAGVGIVLLAACGKEPDAAPAKVPSTAPAPEKGSPGEKPAVAPKDIEPIRRQRDSKVQLLQMDIDKFKEDLKARLAEAMKSQKPDALVTHLKKQLDDAKSQETRIRLMMDDLTAFMEQNRESEAALDFAATRKWVDTTRSEEGERLRKLDAAISGIKDATLKVNASTAEWQGSGISAKPGNLVAYEPTGQWTLGAMAGSSGPKGLPGNQYASACIYKQPHGSLLVRVGETGAVFMAGGAGVVQVSGDGGLVSARCNDKNCSDNSGFISLRVVLIPLVE